MRMATDRASRLAGRLLQAGKREVGALQKVDASELCGEVAHLARRTFQRRIKIVTEVAPQQFVRADPVSLHQVLMNLVVNARDAIRGRGTITIGIRTARQNKVIITVSDDGVGMNEETVDHIFDPFFTTKANGVGFGLGLATVKDLVERHGGQIDVRSTPGNGTTFWVTLSADRSRAGAAYETMGLGEDLRPAKSAIRVLLADDECVLRRTYRRVLRQHGHEVFEAANGREAIQQFISLDPKPSVVMLDVDMPEVDGVEACRQIRALDPEVPIVFVTGHSDRALHGALSAAGATTVMTKPVDGDRLGQTITIAARMRSHTALGAGETLATSQA